MIRKLSFAAASAAFVMLFAVAGANADTTTDSDTTGLITTDFSLTLSVDQFDPSLGTLTQVTLVVSGLLDGGGKYENLNGDAVNTTMHYTLDQALDVSWSGGALLGVTQNLDNTIPVIADAYDGTFDFGGPSGYTESPYTQSDSQLYIFTLPADLLPFIGTGTVDFSAIGDGAASVWPPNGVSGGTFSLGQATVGVEYTYTPIPEPATVVLCGLAALGLLIRRRR
jgi:hypothetical protein